MSVCHSYSSADRQVLAVENLQKPMVAPKIKHGINICTCLYVEQELVQLMFQYLCEISVKITVKYFILHFTKLYKTRISGHYAPFILAPLGFWWAFGPIPTLYSLYDTIIQDFTHYQSI